MPRRGRRGAPEAGELGQASLLFLGVLAALLAGTLILFSFAQALSARGKHQRAADLAAVSGAQVMSRHYQRLFEPAVFENGLPNPRHLTNAAYLALARSAALRGARRNGVAASRVEVDFPAGGVAPTRIEVSTSGEARLRLGEGRRARDAIPVKASATAEIAPDLNVAYGMPTHGSGGGYDGPLAYRMGKPMRPDVAAAFDEMAAAARARPACTSPSARASLRRRATGALEREAQPLFVFRVAERSRGLGTLPSSSLRVTRGRSGSRRRRARAWEHRQLDRTASRPARLELSPGAASSASNRTDQL